MQLSSLPLQNLQTWSYFNSVRLFDATIESLVVGNDGIAKGGGLLASGEHGPGQPFIAVPTELVLSKERVEHCAKADRQLKELIEAASSLFQVGVSTSFCRGHQVGNFTAD